jgi:hypothetical protein
MYFSKLIWTPSRIFWLNAWINIPKHRLELPPEAAQARDFFESLVAHYESQIENSSNKFDRFPSRFSLSQSGFKNRILATLRSRLAPSILMENRLGSLPNDEFANRKDKEDKRRAHTAFARTRSD